MKPEIEALTGLRFIAALWVFLYHIGDVFLRALFPEFWSYYRLLFQGGGLGVDLFFVLSGFIIAYNYFDRFAQFKVQTYFDFLYKRIARIYPVHLFTLLVLLPISYLITQDDFFLFGSPQALLKHIFLVHAFFPPIGWNIVSWSISCEWLAYMLFPVFALIARPLGSRLKIVLMIILIYTVTILIAIILASPEPGYGYKFSHPLFKLLRIICEFGVGVLLYRLWCNGKFLLLNHQFNRFAAPLITVFILATSHLLISFVWMIPFFFIVIYLIASKQFFLNNFLARPLVSYGGRASYSLYMVHGMVMVIFQKTVPIENLADAGNLIRVLYVGTYIVTTIAMTSISYHFVEEKARAALLSLR